MIPRSARLFTLMFPLVAFFAGAGAAHAQDQGKAPAQVQAAKTDYPQRPITLLVAWSPGGAVDLLARQLGTVLSQDLGQTIIVENKAGANGTIGHAQAVRSAPDGYTAILSTNSTFVIGPHLYTKLVYQHERDLAPVSLVAASPLVLAVNPALKVTSVDALLALARKNPGRLNFASGGQGSTSHLAAEQLMALTGTEMTHIPYQGGGPAATAVAAGEVDFAFLDLGVSLPFVTANRFVALGVSSEKRSDLLPDVPTVAESGAKGFEVTTTFSVFVPAKTPEPVIARLNAAILTALSDEGLKQKLARQGVVIMGTSPQALRDYTSRESERWGSIIKDRNITVN